MITFSVVKSKLKQSDTRNLLALLDDAGVRYMVIPTETQSGKMVVDGVAIPSVPALMIYDGTKKLRVLCDRQNWHRGITVACEYDKCVVCYNCAHGTQERIRWQRQYKKLMQSLLDTDEFPDSADKQQLSKDDLEEVDFSELEV